MLCDIRFELLGIECFTTVIYECSNAVFLNFAAFVVVVMVVAMRIVAFFCSVVAMFVFIIVIVVVVVMMVVMFFFVFVVVMFSLCFTLFLLGCLSLDFLYPTS